MNPTERAAYSATRLDTIMYWHGKCVKLNAGIDNLIDKFNSLIKKDDIKKDDVKS